MLPALLLDLKMLLARLVPLPLCSPPVNGEGESDPATPPLGRIELTKLNNVLLTDFLRLRTPKPPVLFARGEPFLLPSALPGSSE